MNTYAKVLEIVANHVAIHSMPLSLDGEKTLEALGIDSLDRVEISIELEAYFNIDLEADAVSAWTTVQDIINAVENETPLLMTPTPGAAYSEKQDVAAIEALLRRPEPGKVMHVDAIPNDAASLADAKPHDPLQIVNGCSVRTRDGTIFHNFIEDKTARPWVGVRATDGQIFTWLNNGEFTGTGQHPYDIVEVLAPRAEYRDPLIPGGNIKHYSDAELKLAVSQHGKPEAINRISRADLGNFKDNISHDEFAPPNALDDYQRIAVKSAIYPGKGTPFGAMYCALGLGEAGEIQNKVKKAFRDDDMMRITADFPADTDGSRVITTRVLPITPERRTQIIKEMGGNLWYLAALADELGITLSEVAAANLTELCDRGERNTLRGDGDNR